MTGEMARIVEDYVARLRRSMRGATPDVIDECEREIRAHIEDALAARPEASVGALLDVLERLGPPEMFGHDLALYMMVEAGYREWSLPHMVRSTAYWALSTVAGGVVVSLFGLLYGVGIGMTAVGALALTGVPDATASLPPDMARWHPAVTLVSGIALLALLTLVVRWFVGQYVHGARPHTLSGREGGEAWVERTSRRILAIALTGATVTLATGFAAGIYRLETIGDLHRPPDYASSPLAVASGLALLALLLAPVLGVLWTVSADRLRRDRARARPPVSPPRS